MAMQETNRIIYQLTFDFGEEEAICFSSSTMVEIVSTLSFKAKAGGSRTHLLPPSHYSICASAVVVTSEILYIYLKKIFFNGKSYFFMCIKEKLLKSTFNMDGTARLTTQALPPLTCASNIQLTWS